MDNVEAILPTSVKILYNFNEGWIAVFGTEFSSQNYALKIKEPLSINQSAGALYHFRRSYYDVVGIFYQKLSDWTWVQFKASYAFDNNSDAHDLPRRLPHDLKPSGNTIGVVSFFISPPKKCAVKACSQLPNGL